MVKIIDKIQMDLNKKRINYPRSNGIRYDGQFNNMRLHLYSNDAICDSYLILEIIDPDNNTRYLSSVGIDLIKNEIKTRYLNDLDYNLVRKLTVNKKMDKFFNELTSIVKNNSSIQDNLNFNINNVHNQYAPFIEGIRQAKMSWEYLNFIKNTIGIDNDKLVSLRNNNLTLNGTRNPNRALSKNDIIIKIDANI